MQQLCWQWLVEHLLDRARQQNEHNIGQLGELIKFTLLAMNKLAWELPVVCTFFPCLFHSPYMLLNSCSSCQYRQRRCSVQWVGDFPHIIVTLHYVPDVTFAKLCAPAVNLVNAGAELDYNGTRSSATDT